MSVFTDGVPSRADQDTVYARDFSFPLQFNDEADLLMDENEEIIEQSLNLITFIPQGSIRLFFALGSAVQLSVFDMLDEETELIIDTSLRNAFETLEPRVFLDKEFTFDESADQRKIIVIVPYKIKLTGTADFSRLVINRGLITG